MRVHPLRAAQASRDTSPEAVWSVLAPLMAARGRMRVSRDGGRSYRARDERPVTERLPNQPAALLVYDTSGCAPIIFLDLDASRGGPAAVTRDHAALTGLLAKVGARWFSDISPNGGRHIYVPLDEPAPFHEARALTLALAARTPTLDPLPMLNLHAGCIRPPGARHRTGGHQTLDGSASAAADVLHRRTSTRSWRRLQEETATLADQVDRTSTASRARQEGQSDAQNASEDISNLQEGQERLEALRGVTGPDTAFTQVARTGQWPAEKYRTASEARQGVIWAAVASGWSITDVARRLSDGTWPGLASLYARYSSRHRHGALVRDWRRAIAFEKTRRDRRSQERGSTAVRESTTSPHQTQAGGGGSGVRSISGQAANREVRVWLAAVDLLTKNADPAERAVLYALGEAAALRGSLGVEHGNRSLAIATGLDQSTVGRILKRLREQPIDRLLVDLVRGAEGVRANTYLLVVPPLLRPACEKKPWRRGKIHAVRPVFRELGMLAAFVYGGLEQAREPISGRDLAEAVGFGHSATYEALAVLAAWGLADKTKAGWVLGKASTTRLAEQMGVDERISEQVGKYRAERYAWWRYLGLLHLLPIDVSMLPVQDDGQNDGQDGEPDLGGVPEDSGDQSLHQGAHVLVLDRWRTPQVREREHGHDLEAVRLLEDILGARIIDSG